MNFENIEQLVKIVRDAKVTELSVTADGTTVRIRKPLITQKPKVIKKMETAKQPPKQETVASPQEIYIKAPMVGIFHNSEDISAGGLIKTGQIVGYIESMKLMNDVISDKDGVVEEILVEDDMPVEYGQNLFRLEGSEKSAVE